MCPLCKPLGSDRGVCTENSVLFVDMLRFPSYPDDDIVNSPTHSHPTHPHQCEALPTDDSAPPTPSAEACLLPPPPPPRATENCHSPVPRPQLEEVEGELQDTDLLSDYTVLSLTPSAVGSGEERSHDGHVTGET